MKERKTFVLGIAVFAVLGFASLNVGTPELGCGGTELAGESVECAIAEFEMTMESADLEPVQRKMCLRTLKVDGGCTAYEYNLVGIDDDLPKQGELMRERMHIVYGKQCDANELHGVIVENVEDEPLTITMTGTPVRSPSVDGDGSEPLAFGTCMSEEWQEGEFELMVVPTADEG